MGLLGKATATALAPLAVLVPITSMASVAGAEDHRWGSPTELISTRESGPEARGIAAPWPAISGDGRFVVFVFAGPLVPEDTNGRSDVYVRDRQEGSLELITRGTDGGPADAGSWHAVDISDDGRFVVFASTATNLVTGDTNSRRDVFRHDRLLGTTEIVSGAGGVPAEGISLEPAISGDGLVVAFTSNAANLVPGDTNQRRDVFVWDSVAGSTTRVSVSSSGRETSTVSRWASLSADGRFVSFGSKSHKLAPDDTNRTSDVFVHDRRTGDTSRVSVGSDEQQGRGPSMESSLSADGRFVAFGSHAPNLVPGDRNGLGDIFVHDRRTGITTAASVDSAGRIRGGGSYGPTISADGSRVAFDSSAQLTPVPPYINTDVFVHDRSSGDTALVSAPVQGDAGGGLSAQISSDGRDVVWWSSSDDLVEGSDDGIDQDVFAATEAGAGLSGSS